MEKIELMYHFASLSLATLIFFMKFTAGNVAVELIIKIIGKLLPLFVIGFSIVQIFKYFGVL